MFAQVRPPIRDSRRASMFHKFHTGNQSVGQSVPSFDPEGVMAAPTARLNARGVVQTGIGVRLRCTLAAASMCPTGAVPVRAGDTFGESARS